MSRMRVLVGIYLGLGVTFEQAQAYSENACETEYREALYEGREAASAKDAPRLISNIYVRAAGRCRDAGGAARVIELFEEAIQADPKNAHAYRLYGDYYMGHRGLYEYAAEQYHKALEVVDAKPEDYDSAFRRDLERSMEILHRDGKNGVPVLVSRPVSIFVGAKAAFDGGSRPPITAAAADDGLEELGLRVRGVIDATEGAIQETINGDIFLDSLLRSGIAADDPLSATDVNDTIANRRSQIFEDRARLQAVLNRISGGQGLDEALRRNIQRTTQDGRFEGDIYIRPNFRYLPYLRLSGEFVTGQDANTDRETLNTLERHFLRLAGTLGKNIVLPHDLDLNLEFEVARTQLRFHDQVADVRTQDEDGIHYIGRTSLTYNFGFDVLKFSGGFSFVDLENLDSRDESANGQNFSLRLSSFSDPDLVTESDRFRGQRSTHLEITGIRTERVFRSDAVGFPSVDEEVVRGVLSYEELGILKGWADIAFQYEWRKLWSEFGPTSNIGFGRAVDGHIVRAVPTFIPIYHLYSSDFWDGIEHFTLSLPVEWAFGDSRFDRVSAKLDAALRYVTPWGFALNPRLQVGYARSYQLDADDFLAFVQLGISS